jgi:hypothetical protein
MCRLCNPPEDEQIMLETCRGSWFSINWMKSVWRWFHYPDKLWYTVSKTLSLSPDWRCRMPEIRDWLQAHWWSRRAWRGVRAVHAVHRLWTQWLAVSVICRSHYCTHDAVKYYAINPTGWTDGIESWWGRDFLCPSRTLGPTQPPIQWVPDLSRGLSGRGVALTTHPSSVEVKERVELCIYSPLGLRGRF